MEITIADLEHHLDDARSGLGAAEKRRAALASELEDCRIALENAERARKNAEGERDEATSRVSELNIHITSLGNEKRRLEGDYTGMCSEIEEMRSALVSNIAACLSSPLVCVTSST